jgi:hypothetical protein
MASKLSESIYNKRKLVIELLGENNRLYVLNEVNNADKNKPMEQRFTIDISEENVCDKIKSLFRLLHGIGYSGWFSIYDNGNNIFENDRVYRSCIETTQIHNTIYKKRSITCNILNLIMYIHKNENYVYYKSQAKEDESFDVHIECLYYVFRLAYRLFEYNKIDRVISDNAESIQLVWLLNKCKSPIKMYQVTKIIDGGVAIIELERTDEGQIYLALQNNKPDSIITYIVDDIYIRSEICPPTPKM